MTTLNFDPAIHTHKPELLNFAMSFTKDINDADDLVQDTYVKAIRYYHLYQEGTNLKGWLYTIMKNTYINNYRSKKMRSRVVETTEDLISYHLVKSASSNRAEAEFMGGDINKALNNLSDEYRIPFLKYFEGYKYYEIAEELQIPIGTVKTRIFVARKRLRSKLKMYN
jgi:RNA polymerase sigma factor (sigma-70 family)